MAGYTPTSEAFEIAVLRRRGPAFQDFFAELMEEAYPNSFRRITSHGSLGDMKCDGFLESDGTVFQVYGPDDFSPMKTLLKKISGDFQGARREWGATMRRWVFVHNAQALPAQAVHRIETIKNENPNFSIGYWGYRDLLTIFRQLSADGKRRVLPQRPEDTGGGASDAGAQFPSMPHTYDLVMEKKLSTALGPQPDGWNANLRLSLLKPIPDARRSTKVQGPQRKDRRVVIQQLNGYLRDNPCLLLCGDAGVGKSTILRQYALTLVRRRLHGGIGRGVERVPVVVDLWEFGEGRSLIELLSAALRVGGSAVEPDDVIALLRSQSLTVLLDGADEIPHRNRRECLAQIAQLRSYSSTTNFVISSRPYPDVPEGFACLNVAPLADDEVERALRHVGGDIASLSSVVREFCRCPLTLRMITGLLGRGQALPKDLGGLFELDLNCKLQWDERHGRLRTPIGGRAVLEETAFELFAIDAGAVRESRWVELAAATIRRLHEEGIMESISAEEMLRSLLLTGLIRTAAGRLEFSHRSFMEYLAASRIARRGLAFGQGDLRRPLGPAIAEFLCGMVNDVESLLESQFRVCTSVDELAPFMQAASAANCRGGRFEALHGALAFVDILLGGALNDTHKAEAGNVARMRECVSVFVSFGPKCVPKLRSVAGQFAVQAGLPGGARMFDDVVTGLESLQWQGAPLHRRLLACGYMDWLEEPEHCSHNFGCYLHPPSAEWQAWMDQARKVDEECGEEEVDYDEDDPGNPGIQAIVEDFLRALDSEDFAAAQHLVARIEAEA